MASSIRKGARAATRSRGVARAGSADAARERRRVVAELRALAHPLRLKLFELLAERPRTTMQVATLLGEPPTRLYHHVNALERAGLVRLRETRPVRGTVEKYYEAVVGGIKGGGAGVLEQGAARRSARAAASAVFEQARQDLLASLAGPPRAGGAHPMLLRMLFTASPARAASVRKRLLALIKAVRAERPGPPQRSGPHRRRTRAGEERWALTIGLAPSWPRRSQG